MTCQIRSRAFGAIAGAVLALLGPVDSATGRDWLQVETQGFRFLSHLSEDKTLELTTEFETFRRLVLAVTNADHVKRAAPFDVFVFGSVGESAKYRPSRAAGFFSNRLRGRLMVVAPYAKGFTRDILYHEYIHFVLHSQGGIPYPVWYDEGFAEFFSTTELRGDVLVVGMPSTNRLDWFRMAKKMAWGSILSRENYKGLGRRNTGMFYAQSWLLVHYLQNREAETPLKESLTKYFRLSGDGVQVKPAFQEAFGMSVGELDRKIDRYTRKGTFPLMGVDAGPFIAMVEPKLSVISEQEMAPKLGDLAFEYGSKRHARKIFKRILAAEPEHARALIGLADLASDKEDYDEADQLHARALASDPDDYLVHLEIGGLALDRASEDEESSDVSEYVERAQKHFRRAIELAPEVAEGYAGLGSTFLLPGQEPEGGRKALERAQVLAPSILDVKLKLAELNIETGRKAEARRLLNFVLAWRHGGETEDEVEELEKRLEESEE